MATKSESDLSKEINDQYLLAKRYLDPIHQRMNDQEELYRTYLDPSTYEHNARVFDPRVFRVIETITPRMVANEPTGSFYPAEAGDTVTAHILNALIKYDWRRAEMFPKLVMFVKSMLIFGTAFGRNYWELKECDKQRMVAKQVAGKMVWTPKNTETIKVTEFDGPNFEVLNIYDCFPDPNATSLKNMRWFIYRTFKSLKELEAMNETKGTEYYKNLDQLKGQMADKNKKGSTPTDLQYREHRRTMLSTQELLGEDVVNKDIVVLRRFTDDRWVDYLPEYNLIIRDIANPYFGGGLPLVYGCDYPYPGELYGMGEIEPVDRIQRAINAVLNQRLDNVQLTLNTMWKVKKNANVDLHTLFSAPGNVITTDDMTAVEPIATPDVTGATFVQTMNYLTAAMQNGSGITDYTVGINSKTNTASDTATGTRLIQAEANAQFKLKIQLFNHMVVENIANQWKDLRLQYTTEEQKIRIVGKEEVSAIQKTQLGTMDINGGEIAPGELEKQSKLQVFDDGNFAFLNLQPGDIQPSIVGDYDFIAKVSSETTTDPMMLKENFFVAVKQTTDPAWVQGLASQGKMPDWEKLTSKTYDELEMGLEGKDFITDLPQQPAMAQPGMPGQPMPSQPGQPMTPEQLQEMVHQAQVQATANQPFNKVSSEMAQAQMMQQAQQNGQQPITR